jgi:hypothetical protein
MCTLKPEPNVLSQMRFAWRYKKVFRCWVVDHNEWIDGQPKLLMRSTRAPLH